MDPNTVATLAIAGMGGVTTVAIWALRLEGRMTTHEKTDDVIHTHVKETLDRMETKLDKVLELKQ